MTLSRRLIGAVVLVVTGVAPGQTTARSELPLTPELAKIFAGGEPETIEQLAAMERYVQALLEKILPSTVNIGGAAGVIVPGGFVLTAGHVLTARKASSRSGSDAIRVTLDDGRRLRTKALGLSNSTDTGLLKIETEGIFPHLEMGRSSELKEGEWCVMLGFPGGPKKGMKPPLRLGRVLRVVEPGRGYLVTDCTMSAGDSGGPLFDMQGRVIGINSRISRNLAQNMHTPIDAFHHEWKRLVAGEVMGRQRGRGSRRRGLPPTPGWLGAIADPKASQAKIIAVSAGSPAAKAGMQPGDIILRIGNHKIISPRSLTRRLARTWSGDRVAIQLRRGDEELTIDAVIAAPPKREPTPNKPATPKPAAKKKVVR